MKRWGPPVILSQYGTVTAGEVTAGYHTKTWDFVDVKLRILQISGLNLDGSTRIAGAVKWDNNENATYLLDESRAAGLPALYEPQTPLVISARTIYVTYINPVANERTESKIMIQYEQEDDGRGDFR